MSLSLFYFKILNHNQKRDTSTKSGSAASKKRERELSSHTLDASFSYFPTSTLLYLLAGVGWLGFGDGGG